VRRYRRNSDEDLRRLDRRQAFQADPEAELRRKAGRARRGLPAYYEEQGCRYLESLWVGGPGPWGFEERLVDFHHCPGSFGGSLIARHDFPGPSYWSQPMDILASYRPSDQATEVRRVAYAVATRHGLHTTRRNPDERTRRLERRWRESGAIEDESAWLRARVRGGDLSPHRLAAAAALGHPAAVLATDRLAPPLKIPWGFGISWPAAPGGVKRYGPFPRHDSGGELLELFRSLGPEFAARVALAAATHAVNEHEEGLESAGDVLSEGYDPDVFGMSAEEIASAPGRAVSMARKIMFSGSAGVEEFVRLGNFSPTLRSYWTLDDTVYTGVAMSADYLIAAVRWGRGDATPDNFEWSWQAVYSAGNAVAPLAFSADSLQSEPTENPEGEAGLDGLRDAIRRELVPWLLA
jgi:hypothetical protein